MKLAIVLLFLATNLVLGQSKNATNSLEDQLLKKLREKKWKSLRYLGTASLENYNRYAFVSPRDLSKQNIERGLLTKTDKFTWSLHQDVDTNFCYLVITDNVTKIEITYRFDQVNSQIIGNKLFFNRKFDEDAIEELFLNYQ